MRTLEYSISSSIPANRHCHKQAVLTITPELEHDKNGSGVQDCGISNALALKVSHACAKHRHSNTHVYCSCQQMHQ